MKNFNLLQIIPALESGGVEIGTIDLANFLAEKGMGSFVVSKGGMMERYLNFRQTKHFNLPVHSKNFLKMPFVAKKLNKIVIDNNINIVHVRSRAPAWLLQFMLKKKFKSISTFHNVYDSKNFFKKKYNLGLTKVDYIIAISDYVKSSIIKRYEIDEKKITVINRGTDTNFLNPELINENEFHKFILKYNIPTDKKIILFPGRLTSWKGQINFLKIIESYKDDQIMFYFVGDDKNLSYTSKFIKEIKNKNIDHNCKVLGNLTKENLKMIYRCADIVISAPLIPEGFGRTISESLSMKKIILSYNYGGAKNQLENLDDIYKIKPNDQKEMKNRIDKVLELPNEVKLNLGNISRQHIIDNFSTTKMLNKYLYFYQDIVL